MATEDMVKRINKTLTDANLVDDLKYLCGLVEPRWRCGTFAFKKLTGGLSNDIYKCFVSDKEDDALIVRVYTPKFSCNLIDHGKEIIGLQAGFAAGVTTELHIVFNNGLVYDFAPGQPMRWGYLWDDHIARNFMNTLAKLHSIDLTKLPLLDRDGSEITMEKKYSCMDKLRETVKSIPEECKNFPERQKRIEKNFWTKQRLLEELDQIEDLFSSFDFNVVYTHHDAWVNNVIYNKDTDKVTLIDFEISDYNYEAFDLALVFNSFQWFEKFKEFPDDLDLVGVSDEEMKLPRDDDHKRKLSRMYFEEKCRIQRSGPQDFVDPEFEAFYNQTLMLEVFIFLFWAILNLSQCDNKFTTFDVLGYWCFSLGDIDLRGMISKAWRDDTAFRGTIQDSANHRQEMQGRYSFFNF